MQDSNRLSLNNRYVIRIAKSTVAILVVLLVLNLPRSWTQIITVINVEKNFMNAYYGTLSYSFNLLELLLCFWGILTLTKNNKGINIIPILGVVLVKDFILFIGGETSPFSLNTWEMYLWPFLGCCCCLVVCHYKRTKAEIDIFLDWIIICNFIYQILLLVLGRTQEGAGIEAVGQGSNSVGYLCAIHIVYTLLTREKDKRAILLIIVSMLSIVLSGSRFSLLITFSGILLFSGYILKTVNKKMRRIIVVSIGLVSAVLVVTLVNPEISSKYLALKKISSLFSGGDVVQNLMEDQSLQERFVSMDVGLKLILENPLGIANSYIDVYLKTNEMGFYAFPHSTLITLFLLWGPIVLLCLCWILSRMYIAHKMQKEGLVKFLIYMLICLTFYGGLETAPKVYTYLFCVFSATNIELKFLERKRL